MHWLVVACAKMANYELKMMHTLGLAEEIDHDILRYRFVSATLRRCQRVEFLPLKEM